MQGISDNRPVQFRPPSSAKERSEAEVPDEPEWPEVARFVQNYAMEANGNRGPLVMMDEEIGQST
jgi:hypothetical protein